MKKTVFYTSGLAFMLVILVLAFSSCERPFEKTNEAGNLRFSLQMDELQNMMKSSSMDTSNYMTYHLLISVMNQDSILIMDKELIPMYQFSNRFISEQIELETGTYFLSEFMVINPQSEVIFATPRNGSVLSHLVQKPLPIAFSILSGTSKTLQVEVVPVGNYVPEDFGYISFGVQVVKPLTFYTAVVFDNPMIMAPGLYVPAQIGIHGSDGWDYSFKIEAKITQLVIRAANGNYEFRVNAAGHNTSLTVPIDRLMNTSAKSPLIISIGNDTMTIKKLSIHTTPKMTADAIIYDLSSSLNFGDSKFFSASFTSEPVLTVMRTTRSLMFMDIGLQLPKSATIKKVELIFSVLGEIYPMHWDSMISSMPPPYFGFLRQVVEPWDEDSITWENQPKTILANQVMIEYQPWSSMRQRVYDVTRLFVPEQEIAAPNYGFMFFHNNEQIPGGIQFASSDADNPQIRPQFKVYYYLPK